MRGVSFRVLITGSRSWDDIAYIRRVLASLGEQRRDEELVLVSGACPTGADRLCEVVAAELGWLLELHPADWGTYGKRAGFLRNAEMVETEPDIVVGFVRNASKGAAMTVNLAKKHGLPTIAHYWNDYPTTNYKIRRYNEVDSDDVQTDTLF